MRALLSGNYAIAEAVRLSRVQLVAAYPITPQTPIYERVSEMESEGRLGGKMMRMESEHSAMGACIAASTTGVRVFTATSSQGLALMHEMLHYASGSRVPIVMACVNRVLAVPWAFGSDQTDTLSQRDTGWMQFYCENGQEALDTVIQAYKIAEKTLLPVMIVIDAFFTSHFIEPIDIPDESSIDAFLPRGMIPKRLDVNKPTFVASVVNADQYSRFRKRTFDAMEDARATIKEVNDDYKVRIGRGYGPVESINTEDAEIVLVTSGSITSTARVALRSLREKGHRAGLLKIKAFRPFPVKEVQEALKNVPRAAVVDRNISVGREGIFCEELKAALYPLVRRPKVTGYIAGLCGADVSPEMLEDIVVRTIHNNNEDSLPIWVEKN